MYMYIYMHVCTCMYIYIYIHTYICIYIGLYLASKAAPSSARVMINGRAVVLFGI